jgi:hypothetical protein
MRSVEQVGLESIRSALSLVAIVSVLSSDKMIMMMIVIKHGKKIGRISII